MPTARLSVRNLTAAFHTDRGVLRAVAGVSFEVPEGRTVALVGESGCGKSVTALSILRLLPDPPGRITAGEILFGNRDLLGLSEREMQRVRGAQVAMTFQEPMTSLNPVHTVGKQIAEVQRIHGLARGKSARVRGIEMLELVGVPAPNERFDAFPHQLSGGVRQRVMIALALACNPKVLVADEPTADLDATSQAQVLGLLRELQRERQMSLLLITRDLPLVAEVAQEVVVMHAGQVVETATTAAVLENPGHPYTRGLVASVPHSSAGRDRRPRRLTTIPGLAPDLVSRERGCRFADRCDRRATLTDRGQRCYEDDPDLVRVTNGRTVRCHFAEWKPT